MFLKRLAALTGVLVLFVLLALVAASCEEQRQDAAGPARDRAVFGTGYIDQSPVIAKVGELKITQQDLDLRYEELPPDIRKRFDGEGWEFRFLRYMVDEALLVQEAERRRLELDPRVSQMLISQRRHVLKSAMRDYELMKDKEPTEEDLREYFELNRDKYQREGFLHVRHIACQSREAANACYDQIRQNPGDERTWGMMVAQYSTNYESAKQMGDLGWFSREGFLPAMPYGKDFARAIWDWKLGLHEPALIGGEWHVIDVLERELERPLTFAEARDRVVQDFLPDWQRLQADELLREVKGSTPIEYFGAYRPGDGKTPKELFERAWYAGTPDQKLDYYGLLVQDFPEDELADDALFMMANIHLDTWSDVPIANRLLLRLVNEYPHSELYDDAQYMLEHMRDPNFRKPRSIEDLKPQR